MGLPETDGWHVEVCVVSRFEGPWARHVDSDSDGSTRKCFDECSRAHAISVQNLEDSKTSLQDPDSNNTEEELDLWCRLKLEMHSEANDGGGCKEDVDDLEGLIESMTEDGAGLNADDHESRSSLDILEVTRKQQNRDLRSCRKAGLEKRATCQVLPIQML